MAFAPGRQLTYEEWVVVPDDEGVHTELIDGEVSVAPPRTMRHQEIVGRLLFAFAMYLRAHGGGEIFPPVNVCLAKDQGFGPDLVFVHEWGDDPLSYYGPPPLVIEVVTDLRRDLRIKRDRYERYGVPEYWAVLPEAEQVQVFRLMEGRYEVAVAEPPATISPLAVPGLEIDLREVFAD